MHFILNALKLKLKNITLLNILYVRLGEKNGKNDSNKYHRTTSFAKMKVYKS